jgi:outer membrane protein OmpA-like peptidoglycan-associated protein
MTQALRLVVAGAVSLFAAGCASVEWTETLLAKREVEVDARFVRVETDVREQGERIDRVEHSVSRLDERLTETQALVRATPSPAPAPVVSRPRPLPASPPGVERALNPGRTLVTVVHVPFAFDRADLGPMGEAALDSILKELRDNPRLTIDLEGSTDTSGGLEYNMRLSKRRVDAVRRWLLGHGVERARIMGAIARGPLVNAAVADESKRRVMVKLMRVE